MDNGHQIVTALTLAVPVACIAWTLTQEEIFREVRQRLKAYQARNRRSWWRRKLAYSPTCPYCLSHYLAAVFVFALQFKLLADDWRGYLVSLFSVVLIANVYISLYHLLRVSLRAARAMADRAEAVRAGAQRQEQRRILPYQERVVCAKCGHGFWTCIDCTDASSRHRNTYECDCPRCKRTTRFVFPADRFLDQPDSKVPIAKLVSSNGDGLPHQGNWSGAENEGEQR